MEEIRPSVYVDGAHNVDGIRAFLETVEQRSCAGRRLLLYSTVRDKQYQAAAALLAGTDLFDMIFLTALQGERALPLGQLVDTFGQYTGIPIEAYDTLEAALMTLLGQKEERDEVYIVGSLYLVGEVKALLRSLKDDQF